MLFGFSPTQSRARFDAMCAQASLAEALGFDVIWAHEHHSGGSTYPSPLMTLAALAGSRRASNSAPTCCCCRSIIRCGSPRMQPWWMSCPVAAEHLIVGEASFCIDAIERYRAIGIKEIA